MLVGRGAPCRRIDALLDGARSGTSGILLLQGEAGIGKSTLLAHAGDRADGMTRLAMTGVEREAELAFAGLTELLRPVMGIVDDLPAAPADALRSALALRAEAANPLAVCVALLEVLVALAADAPVLVVVDDAQWVDEPSLAALSFAARRLHDERVAVLAAARPDRVIALDVPGADRLALAGLDDRDARRLVAERRDLSGAAVDQLLAAAAGNPLALLELPDTVGPIPSITDAPRSAVGDRVRAAFRDRLDTLPEPNRLALAVAAADEGAALRELLAAFGRLGLDDDALRPAEQDALVVIDGDVVRFRHPLLRAAAYDGLDAPQRRAVHAALADAIVDRSGFERRTWHRAAAALGPDDDVAQALEDVARAAEHRGALPTTAHGYARAAGLTCDEDRRAQRLLAGADAWLAAGHWDEALDLLSQAEAHALDPGLRADIAASTGQLEVYRAGPATGLATLVAAADAIEADDPERAARLLTYAVNAAAMAADADGATVLAARTRVCGDRAGGLSAVAATMASIEAGLLTGDPGVPDALEPLAQLAEALIDSDFSHAEHVVSLVALADFVLERYDDCDRLIDLLVQRAHDTGRSFLLAFTLVGRAELDFRRGRWASAYAAASAEQWGVSLSPPGMGAWLDAALARLEAGLGRTEAARRHGTAALDAARATGTHAVEAWAHASLGFLELGQDQPAAAVGHLSAVDEIFGRGGVVDPGVLWWAPDLVEAHWRLGDLDAAQRQLERFREQAERTGRQWALAATARCAGMLAPAGPAMEAAFAAAVEAHERLDAPFELARTHLVWGERRLRLGSPGADVALRSALDGFDRLGAEPWSQRAAALVALTDAAGEAAGAPDEAALTRQERLVAAIVGRGRTNREAADELFVSTKTIAFHLRNIYRKLDIRSRTELAVWIADHGGAEPTP